MGGELRVAEADLEDYLESCVYSPSEEDTGCEELLEGSRPVSPNSAETTPGPSTAAILEVPTFAGRRIVRVLGSVAAGASIWLGKARYPLKCPKEFFGSLLDKFSGQTARAGTSFSGPEPGSLGEWVQEHLGTRMNPTYAIAGLLIHEEYATRPKPGYIRFFDRKPDQPRPG